MSSSREVLASSFLPRFFPDLVTSLWETLFPVPLSSEAEARIKALVSEVKTTNKIGPDLFQEILDILVEDQSERGVRLHKGFALWWLASEIGTSDSARTLDLMLQSFVEDVLSHGNEALQGFAATSLKTDFGLSSEKIVALKDLVIEKSKLIFYPSNFVREFVKGQGEFKVARGFEGVTEESQLQSIVAQAKEKLATNLRRSINTAPTSEVSIQDVVLAILFHIDPSTEREKTIGKSAERESRIDFSMLRGSIGVEVKLIKDRGQKGAIVDQISADIANYTPHFKRMLFVVYDAAGAIDDVARFAADIVRGRSEIDIVIIKH